MTMIRRSGPFDELFSLRRAMDRLFEDDFFRTPRAALLSLGGAQPALDVTTNKDELVVRASLPGWKPEDVDITLTGRTLTIAGELKEDQHRDEESWIINEIKRTTFSRTLELPEGLVPDKATATYENGLLTLRIPKAEEIKPRSIRIQPNTNAQSEPELVGAGSQR